MKFQPPDYNFVSEEEFMSALKEICNDPKKNARNTAFDEALSDLKVYGKASFREDKRNRNFLWRTFFMADEEVFDMIPVIEDSEYDPLDNDSFNIAFEIYKAGWRKHA